MPLYPEESDIQGTGEDRVLSADGLVAATEDTFFNDLVHEERGLDRPQCDGDLRWARGSSVVCEVISTIDEQELEMTVVAYPVEHAGGDPGVLLAEGELSEDARWALFNGSNEVVLQGRGTAFGMDDIAAEDLAQTAQDVVGFDGEGVEVPPGWNLQVDSCESDMDFEEFEPVECAATDTETGEAVRMWTLPAPVHGDHNGLLVSAEVHADD